MLQILNSKPNRFIHWVSKIFNKNRNKNKYRSIHIEIPDKNNPSVKNTVSDILPMNPMKEILVFEDENVKNKFPRNNISKNDGISPFFKRREMKNSPLYLPNEYMQEYVHECVQEYLNEYLQLKNRDFFERYDSMLFELNQLKKKYKRLASKESILINGIKNKNEEYNQLLCKYESLKEDAEKESKKEKNRKYILEHILEIENKKPKTQDQTFRKKIEVSLKILENITKNTTNTYQENKDLHKENEKLKNKSQEKENIGEILKRDTSKIMENADKRTKEHRGRKFEQYVSP